MHKKPPKVGRRPMLCYKYIRVFVLHFMLNFIFLMLTLNAKNVLKVDYIVLDFY